MSNTKQLPVMGPSSQVLNVSSKKDLQMDFAGCSLHLVLILLIRRSKVHRVSPDSCQGSVRCVPHNVEVPVLIQQRHMVLVHHPLAVDIGIHLRMAPQLVANIGSCEPTRETDSLACQVSRTTGPPPTSWSHGCCLALVPTLVMRQSG